MVSDRADGTEWPFRIEDKRSLVLKYFGLLEANLLQKLPIK